MLTLKNHNLHGVTTPSSVGCGLSTVVVTGMMAPGGQVVQIGSGVVVVGVVVVVGPVPPGTEVTPELKIVDSVQSAVKTPADGPRKVTTLVAGHEKPSV